MALIKLITRIMEVFVSTKHFQCICASTQKLSAQIIDMAQEHKAQSVFLC